MSVSPPLTRVLADAQISFDEVVREVAVHAYEEQIVGLAVAARLAKMERFAFQQLVAERGIDLNYDVAAFEEDLQTLAFLDKEQS